MLKVTFRRLSRNLPTVPLIKIRIDVCSLAIFPDSPNNKKVIVDVNDRAFLTVNIILGRNYIKNQDSWYVNGSWI